MRLVGLRLLVFIFFKSLSKAKNKRDLRQGISRSEPLALLRGAAADPRVLSNEHDRDQRLYRSRDGELLEPARKPAQRDRRDDAEALYHAIQRWCFDLRRLNPKAG